MMLAGAILIAFLPNLSGRLIKSPWGAVLIIVAMSFWFMGSAVFAV